MLLNICFGFMMLIASLIELPIAKTRMWQKHKIQLANFDMASLRVIWFRWARFWVAGTSKMSRAESARCNSLLVRCGLVIVPVSSETEHKFEDAMEVTASSPLF
jgi:hypothetical protein